MPLDKYDIRVLSLVVIGILVANSFESVRNSFPFMLKPVLAGLSLVSFAGVLGMLVFYWVLIKNV